MSCFFLPNWRYNGWRPPITYMQVVTSMMVISHQLRVACNQGLIEITFVPRKSVKCVYLRLCALEEVKSCCYCVFLEISWYFSGDNSRTFSFIPENHKSYFQKILYRASYFFSYKENWRKIFASKYFWVIFSFSLKLRGRRLSSRISEGTPSFCTVYAVSRGKLSSVRPSDSETIKNMKDDMSDMSCSTSNSSGYSLSSQAG